MPPAASDARVVVIGDIALDVLVTPAGPVRRDTDTPSTVAMTQGGSAANVAAWLGSLGAGVDFVGCVGAGDAEAQAAPLQAFGVRAHLIEHPSLPTARIVILIEGDHRSFLTDGGAARALGASAVTDPLLRGASAVHLTGHSLLAPWQRAEASDLIARARALGVPVVVDPSSAGHLNDAGVDAVRDAIAGVDALLPNLDEARALTGLVDPVEQAVALTSLARAVVVTLGSDGVVVAVRGEEPVRLPAVPATVLDPTGAGDAFAAGYHRARVDGASDVDAARFAASVAAGAVALPGGRPALLG